MTVLARALVVLMALHMAIGIKLTADTVIACRKSGVSYYKENKLFWARRISGFAIFVFMILHLAVFMGKTGGNVRLKYFGVFELLGQILLVISVAVHVITNVKPMMISFGIKSLKEYSIDILVVLSVLMLFAGAAFLIYYLRWNYF